MYTDDEICDYMNNGLARWKVFRNKGNALKNFETLIYIKYDNI